MRRVMRGSGSSERSQRTLLAATTAALLGLAALAPSARAGVVFTDGFGDADRDNDGTTDGATATNPADVGIKWYAIEGSSPPPKPTFTVRDGAAGLGSGPALHAESRGSGGEWIGVLPAETSLGGAVGDKLVLSLRFRINGDSPHGVPSSLTTGSFRFGLYQDADNEFGTSGWGTGDGNFDGATAPGAADDPGWFARLPVGGTAASDARVFEEVGNNGDILAGSGAALDADTVASGSLSVNDALAHTLTLTLERVAEGVLATLDLDGSSISGTETTTAAINTTTFDYLALVNNGVDFDYLVDDVSLRTVPIPEPAAAGAAFGGLAIAALSRRVRRRTQG